MWRVLGWLRWRFRWIASVQRGDGGRAKWRQLRVRGSQQRTS